MGTTRVSVLSDTHGILDDAIEKALADSDAIIHAGDIGSPFLLDALEAIAPVYAVRGNCDWDEYGRDVTTIRSLVIDGVRIYLAHIPEDAGAPCDRRYPAAGERGHLLHRTFAAARWNQGRDFGGLLLPHMVIHGHTHVPRLETLDGVVVLNPGSATKPKGTDPRISMARFTIADGVPGAPSIEYFS